MLRRLATLCVLLLCLSGVVPAIAACVFESHGGDCCPGGQACGTEGMPVVVNLADASCCVSQPAPALTSAVIAQDDRRSTESPASDLPVTLESEFPRPSFASHELTAGTAAPAITINQQQVYLRTGRLRL